MNTLICRTCGCSLVRLGISKEESVSYRHRGQECRFCCQRVLTKFRRAIVHASAAWMENEAARPKMWAVLTGTRSFSPPFAIQSIPSTIPTKNGAAPGSIRRPLTRN